MADRPTSEAEPTARPVIVKSGLRSLRSAVVSPSGLLAATYGTGSDKAYSVTVWDVASGSRLARGVMNSPPVAARFTEDETALIVAARPASSAQITRLALGSSGQPLAGEVIYRASDIAGIAMSRDSRTVVMRGRERGLIVLDTMSGATRSLGDSTHADKIAVSPRGEIVVASAGDRITVYRPEYSARDASPVSVAAPDSISSMDCAAGLVVAASANAVSVLWSDASADAYEVFTAPSPVRRIAVSTGGTAVAVAHGNGFAVVDLASGEPLMEQATESRVNRLTFRLDDKVLVTADEDNDARLWDLPELPSRRPDHLDWQSDAPARDDLLQRRPLARALAIRLRRYQEERSPTSFLVHIDGPWGSGKSTLLRLLARELEDGPGGQAQRPPEAEWLTIDFNAWQQSKVGAPWWALMAALRGDLSRGRPWPARWWLRLVESCVRMRRAGAPFLLASVVLLALAFGFLFLLRPSRLTFASSATIAQGAGAVIVAVGTLWAGSKVAARFFLWDSAQGARLYEQSSVNPMLDVSRHFGWLIAKAGRPVVFFIDDLDRCADSYVVELLETVQTLIRDSAGGNGGAGAAKPPSFVVAADGAWIRRSFETAYGQFSSSVAEPGLPLGYLFLDKLFQLRVRVPRVDAVRQELYLGHLLSGTAPEPEGSGTDFREKVNQVLTRLGRSSSEADVVSALSGASPEVRDEVAATAVERLTSAPVEASTEHWLLQFAPLLPPNPGP